MKSLFITLIATFGIIQISVAQTQTNAKEQELLNTMSEKACQCLTEKYNKDSTVIDTQQKFLKTFTDCYPKVMKEMLALAKLRKKALGADVYEEIGIDLGVKLLESNCAPYLKFAEMVGQKKMEEIEGDTEEEQVKKITGFIRETVCDQFCKIKIEGESKKLMTFYIVYNFEGAEYLIKNINDLIGKSITIKYIDAEILDAKTKQFVAVKEIVSVETE